MNQMYNVAQCKDEMGDKACNKLINHYGCDDSFIIQNCQKSCNICVDGE